MDLSSQPQLSPLPGITASEQLRGLKVMMVDDEPVMIEVVSAHLEEGGYTSFLGCSDPTRAMENIRAAQPDLLLLDLMMPGVSGFDILSEIRADERLRYLPVIILTSASDADVKLRALELGATEFLSKPVDPSELLLRLRNSLAFKSYQDHILNYDNLTGLLNRRTFMERLDSSIQSANREHGLGAVLLIDIDRFRELNEALGPRIGDEILAAVASRIEQCCLQSRNESGGGAVSELNICRLGGDEFAVLLQGLSSASKILNLAQSILSEMQRPVIPERELIVTVSVGITVFPDDGAEGHAIMQCADIAMTNAKRDGGNVIVFYSKEMYSGAGVNIELETQLRKALERRQFVLHYQPKVDIATGQLSGVEALLRWNHPDRGLVSPLTFIPLAEKLGLISSIGEWVINRACRDCKAWEAAGLGEISVAVNVSSAQFRDGSLLIKVRDALDASRMDPRRLTLELTESLLMQDVERNIQIMFAVKALGIKLSLDDFGTGYSSLSYLKRFPIDEIKVDRSFVSALPLEPDGAAIVSAVISLAHYFGLHVTAEGVENKHQLSYLRKRKCDAYQGYLFSKPVAFKEIALLLMRARQSRAFAEATG